MNVKTKNTKLFYDKYRLCNLLTTDIENLRVPFLAQKFINKIKVYSTKVNS